MEGPYPPGVCPPSERCFICLDETRRGMMQLGCACKSWVHPSCAYRWLRDRVVVTFSGPLTRKRMDVSYHAKCATCARPIPSSTAAIFADIHTLLRDQDVGPSIADDEAMRILHRAEDIVAAATLFDRSPGHPAFASSVCVRASTAARRCHTLVRVMHTLAFALAFNWSRHAMAIDVAERIAGGRSRSRVLEDVALAACIGSVAGIGVCMLLLSVMFMTHYQL